MFFIEKSKYSVIMDHHRVATEKELNDFMHLSALQSMHKCCIWNQPMNREIKDPLILASPRAENPWFLADFEQLYLRDYLELANKLDMSRH